MRNHLLIAFLTLLAGCAKGPQKDIEVYYNDFETDSLGGISSGKTTVYNQGMVLGRFNSGGFSLDISDIPDHDLIIISFDLNIHDSWDGNQPKIGGPDIWELLIDNKSYIRTTFSNANCPFGTFCPPQSYPMNYPNSNNNPRKGAYLVNQPKACALSNNYGTSTYRIEKTIRHTGKRLEMVCRDKLIQTNADDRLCDESWSVDNIKVRAISLQ